MTNDEHWIYWIKGAPVPNQADISDMEYYFARTWQFGLDDASTWETNRNAINKRRYKLKEHKAETPKKKALYNRNDVVWIQAKFNEVMSDLDNILSVAVNGYPYAVYVKTSDVVYHIPTQFDLVIGCKYTYHDKVEELKAYDDNNVCLQGESGIRLVSRRDFEKWAKVFANEPKQLF